MFIRNTNEKKMDIDWTVISAPGFHADPKKDFILNKNFRLLTFQKKP